MNNDYRIGHFKHAAVDHARFALSNQPQQWIKHAKTLRLSARTLHAAYVTTLAEARVAMRISAAIVANRNGTYIFSGEFREGDDHPMMRVIEAQRMLQPALLIAGLAIETILKALWIQREPNCVANGVGPLDHIQIRLAGKAKADINLSGEEETLLKFLTDIVVFAGRYPTAAKADAAHTEMTIGDDIFSVYEQTFDRFLAEYEGREGRKV